MDGTEPATVLVYSPLRYLPRTLTDKKGTGRAASSARAIQIAAHPLPTIGARGWRNNWRANICRLRRSHGLTSTARETKLACPTRVEGSPSGSQRARTC